MNWKRNQFDCIPWMQKIRYIFSTTVLEFLNGLSYASPLNNLFAPQFHSEMNAFAEVLLHECLLCKVQARKRKPEKRNSSSWHAVLSLVETGAQNLDYIPCLQILIYIEGTRDEFLYRDTWQNVSLLTIPHCFFFFEAISNISWGQWTMLLFHIDFLIANEE